MIVSNPKNRSVSNTLWAYREGQWSRHTIQSEDQETYLEHFAVTNSGTVWYLTRMKKLGHFDLNGCSKNSDRITPLLTALSSKDFQKRVKATRLLMAMGENARPRLQIALENATELETKKRLQAVLEKLDSTRSTSFWFSHLLISGPLNLFEFGDGRLFLTAKSIVGSERNYGPGLVILNADGETDVFAGEEFSVGWFPNNGNGESGPIMTSDGNRFWLPFNGRPEAASLLDLRKCKIIDTLPDPSFKGLQGVAKGGQLIVSRRGTSSIIAYNSHALEERVPLNVTTRSLGRVGATSVADDGTVWAVDAQGDLQRFDGKTWNTVLPKPPGDPLDTLIPGGGSVMLAGNKYGRYFLFKGSKQLDKGKLDQIVKSNRKTFRMQLAPHRVPGSRFTKRLFNVTSDAGGNVWLLYAGYLMVLINDEWQHAASSLEANGFRRGRVGFMSVIGKGNTVYVRTLENLETGKACYGEVRDGTLHFTSAPQLTEPPLIQWPIGNAEGNIWCLGHERVKGRRDQIALRINDRGKLEKLKNAGWPMLVDRAGNTWLGNVAGQNSTRFNISRNGEIVQQVEIPSARSGLSSNTALFSDQPGSVYAWTPLGLQHLTAEEPDFNSYKLGELYVAPNVTSQPSRTGYSKLGFLVATDKINANPNEGLLHLIQLPTKN